MQVNKLVLIVVVAGLALGAAAVATGKIEIPGVKMPWMQVNTVAPLPLNTAPVAEAPKPARQVQTEIPVEEKPAAEVVTMKLAATDKNFLALSGKIDLKYTCYRQNISPALTWKNLPAGTKSLALFMERRDPNTHPFLNWAVFDIAPGMNGIPADLGKAAPPAGGGWKQAVTDTGNIGYAGPCEHSGEHKYVLRLFALDTMTGLPAGTQRPPLIRFMKSHVLAEADLPVIHYYRK